MIEFLSYPPKERDDVKLSSEGKRALRKCISERRLGIEDAIKLRQREMEVQQQ